MLRKLLLGNTGVALSQSIPPFTLADLRDSFRARAEERIAGVTLDTPVIFDGRAAPLLLDDTDSLGEALLERRFLQRGRTAGPMAAVVNDLGDHGMLRLFGVLSHVSKVRDETRMYITEDIGDAARWMAQTLAPAGPHLAELMEALRQAGVEGAHGAQVDPNAAMPAGPGSSR